MLRESKNISNGLAVIIKHYIQVYFCYMKLAMIVWKHVLNNLLSLNTVWYEYNIIFPCPSRWYMLLSGDNFIRNSTEKYMRCSRWLPPTNVTLQIHGHCAVSVAFLRTANDNETPCMCCIRYLQHVRAFNSIRHWTIHNGRWQIRSSLGMSVLWTQDGFWIFWIINFNRFLIRVLLEAYNGTLLRILLVFILSDIN